MRLALPEVDVVCLPRDPCHFVRAVAEGRWFDVPALTDEDRSRADDYRTARQSRELLATAGTLEDFLESLELEAEIVPFDAPNLPRIAQLVHRTNQFNLTTPRYTEAELAALAATPGVHTRFVRLRDRFADRGIVAVLIARERGDALDLDTWLMSCRVLGRTVEHAVHVHVVELARRLGKTRILGRWVPSARNALVKDHYARLGFTCVGDDPAGGSCWERSAAGPVPRSFVAIATAERSLAPTPPGMEGWRA
jgi:FkbH-like protein